MKTLLTLFVLLFSFPLYAEIYYCTEDDRVGFKKNNNNKVTEFQLQKFTIKIDIKNKTVFTEEDNGAVTYNSLITEDGKLHVGLIAQDLVKVNNELDLSDDLFVNVPEDSNEMMSINYSKVVVPLINAVKELSSEIDRLKSEIEQLKKESLK